MTFSTFISNWKRISDESSEMFFIQDIFNMIDFVLEDNRVIETGKYREYERKILAKIVEMVKDDDDVRTVFVKKIDSPSIKKLIELVEQGKFDLEVHNLLRDLNNNITNANYIEILGNLIRDSIKKSVVETHVLMSILIRYLHRKFSPNYLKQLPEKSFTNSFFTQFENTLLNDQTKNTDVLSEIKIFWLDYIDLAIKGAKEFHDSLESSLDSLFHSNNYWLHDRAVILQTLKRNLKHCVNSRNL